MAAYRLKGPACGCLDLHLGWCVRCAARCLAPAQSDLAQLVTRKLITLHRQESNTFRESSVAKKRREAEERAAAAKRELAVDARRAAAQQAATKRQAEQATAAALQQVQPASVTLLA